MDAKTSAKDRLIVLAGNPNVGKSTVFNALTGLKQHTGNWSGKTVDLACGKYKHNGITYTLADVPGCYSLKITSSEEGYALNSIQSGDTDGVILVCDACSLERNLNLFLQICETTQNVVIGLNFMDAAKKKGILIDTDKLQRILGVPVLEINARKKKGLTSLVESTDDNVKKSVFKIDYGSKIEYAIKPIIKLLNKLDIKMNTRYLALRLIEGDEKTEEYIRNCCENNIIYTNILNTKHEALNFLYNYGIDSEDLRDIIAISIVRTAHSICKRTVINTKKEMSGFSLADKILTGKITGFISMFFLLCLVFFLTLKGANYPSEFLSNVLFSFETPLIKLFKLLKFPDFISQMLVFGGYRVLSWVVSVMLIPMAIFFPLFTLLEDIGYLPRIAFNLDKGFKKCCACGKQALTTCMGFGCNAAAVTGTRIIDSPREKLIAILTNSFIPCNGRFPGLISLISSFLVSQTKIGGFMASLILTGFIIISVLLSLGASMLLSKTILKGEASSFTIELPPFRKPQIGQILVRSLLDRTVFVLGRAVAVAFPAGIVLFLLCNINLHGVPIIRQLADFFDPFARLMGLDGVIFTSFLMGIPANEIVLPISLMIYSSSSSLSMAEGGHMMKNIFMSNGWSMVTALCCISFFIMHWPCSTTLMTIKKETGSLKWTFVAFLLPSLFGIITCMLINLIF